MNVVYVSDAEYQERVLSSNFRPQPFSELAS